MLYSTHVHVVSVVLRDARVRARESLEEPEQRLRRRSVLIHHHRQFDIHLVQTDRTHLHVNLEDLSASALAEVHHQCLVPDDRSPKLAKRVREEAHVCVREGSVLGSRADVASAQGPGSTG